MAAWCCRRVTLASAAGADLACIGGRAQATGCDSSGLALRAEVQWTDASWRTGSGPVPELDRNRS